MKGSVDILCRQWIVGFGIQMGCNKFNKKNNQKTPINLFIEIDILFWTFGFEIKWEK